MDVWYNSLVAGILIIFISATESIAATESMCEVKDLNKALECTGLPNPVMISEDYNTIVQQVCRANRSKEVEECIILLETLHDCLNDELFQMMVQTDRYLNMIEYFCSHAEVYVENGLCIAQASTPAQDCLEQAIQDAKEIAEDNENNMTRREAMSALCRPLLIFSSCYSDAVSTLCGNNATAFANKVLEFHFYFCHFTQSETTTTMRVHLNSTPGTLFNKTRQVIHNGTNQISHSTMTIMMILLCLLTRVDTKF